MEQGIEGRVRRFSGKSRKCAEMTALPQLNGEHKAAPASAEERRLDLLRQITKAGGVIAPAANPFAAHGYEYSVEGDDAGTDLLFLAKNNYLEARFFDRVSLCPKCSSHHLNVREICPGCRSSRLTAEGLLHHFRCGNIGLPSEFALSEDGSYLCPKCKRKMYHLGTEYDRLGRAFVCHACARISDNPPIEAVCLSCGQRTPADDLVSIEVFSFVLTSRGSAAIRHGSLFDGSGSTSGSELISAAGTSVYRRAIVLEFLAHELKRMEHFNRRFSVLLVEFATNSNPSVDVAEWLRRLRECLREIDLIGQLADALYLVVLPQTKRREAEQLCQSIAAKLGSESPLTLSSREINAPEDVAGILLRREPQDEHS
jgi:hypothetical protein